MASKLSDATRLTRQHLDAIELEQRNRGRGNFLKVFAANLYSSRSLGIFFQ